MKRKIPLAAALCLIALLSLGSATYAWFTENDRVETSRVETKTAQTQVQLYVSATGGAGFTKTASAPLKPVPGAASETLLPVSTADLKTFVTCGVMEGGYAERFYKAADESRYFHGCVYLQAELTGAETGAKLALYLSAREQDGGPLTAPDDGDGRILNAARLGLRISREDGTELAAHILRISEGENPTGHRENNTRFNGTVLGEDGKSYVLDGSGTAIRAVEDTFSTALEECTVTDGGALPARPLLLMEPGQRYRVDVYYYLEGCDPDCTGSIACRGNDLQLAFFGMLA